MIPVNQRDVSPAPGEKPGALQSVPVAVGATPLLPAVARPLESAASCRVLLVDDQPVFAEGLRAACERAGLAVLATATAADEALPLVRRTRPDVAILPVIMPGLNGFEATRRIREASPGTKVLLLTTVVDERRLADAWRAGAGGIALKSQLPDDLIHAIHEVAGGRPYVCSISEVGLLPIADAGGVTRGMLTRRERQVLQLICEGKSIRQIATDLGITPKTADHHREHIRRKLGVRTTAHLVRWAIRVGLVLP